MGIRLQTWSCDGFVCKRENKILSGAVFEQGSLTFLAGAPPLSFSDAYARILKLLQPLALWT